MYDQTFPPRAFSTPQPTKAANPRAQQATSVAPRTRIVTFGNTSSSKMIDAGGELANESMADESMEEESEQESDEEAYTAPNMVSIISKCSLASFRADWDRSSSPRRLDWSPCLPPPTHRTRPSLLE